MNFPPFMIVVIEKFINLKAMIISSPWLPYFTYLYHLIGDFNIFTT